MNLSLARTTPAVIVQNPRSPVVFDKPFDPREQDVLGKDPVSVRASIDECNRERAEARAAGVKNLPDLEYPAHLQNARQLAKRTLDQLMFQFGPEAVVRWALKAAAMRQGRV